jgi:hypothetical protein
MMLKPATLDRLATRLDLLEQKVAAGGGGGGGGDLGTLIATVNRLYQTTMYMAQTDMPFDDLPEASTIFDELYGGNYSLFQAVFGYNMDGPHAQIPRFADGYSSFYQQVFQHADDRWALVTNKPLADMTFGGYTTTWVSTLRTLGGPSQDKSLASVVFGTPTQMSSVVTAAGNVIKYIDDNLEDAVDLLLDVIEELEDEITAMKLDIISLGNRVTALE